MIRDPRGGHNRKQINESFFRTWTPQMSYVLGLLLADGAIENTIESSRTCYIQFTSIHKEFLEDIKRCLGSDHKIVTRRSHTSFIRRLKITSKESYNLRIGNKIMYNDLKDLGLTPKKANRLIFPQVPPHLFPFFLRGYFDGDGCVYLHKQQTSKRQLIAIVFTSCCNVFLQRISSSINDFLSIPGRVYWQSNAFRLQYTGSNAQHILSFLYSSLNKAPFLKVKYHKYAAYLKSSGYSLSAV